MTDTPKQKNQGEGDVEAARRYREDAEDFAESGKVDEQAEKAREAVEQDDDGDLQEAEESGREKAKEVDPQVKRDR